MVEDALADSEKAPEILLYAALVWHKLGNEDAALSALEEMVERDATFRAYAAEEPDLKTLRGNPRFTRLLES